MITDWTVVFWRALFSVIILLIVSSGIILANGDSIVDVMNEKIFAIGWHGLLAGIFEAIHSSCYVVALFHTYVMNVFIMLSGVSLLTHCIFVLVYDDTFSPTTALLTVVYVVVSVYLTYDGAISSDEDIWYLYFTIQLFNLSLTLFLLYLPRYGNLMAQISVCALIIYRVILRRISESKQNKNKHVDFTPCAVISGLIQCLTALVAGAQVASPTADSYVWLFLGGGLEVPLTNSVMNYIVSCVPAGEVEVYTTLALILQPLWVWLSGISIADSVSLVLGIVLFIAVLLNSIATIHDGDIQSKSRRHVENNFSTYNNYADDEESEGSALFIHTPERNSKYSNRR